MVLLRGAKEGRYARSRSTAGRASPTSRPRDFNGDGTLDLAVAASAGARSATSRCSRTRTTDYAQPLFSEHVIDPRSGAIHAVPIDLKDGKTDLVVVFAQQFER